MAGWELTRGLQNLRAQVNRVFPDRDKASDGTIGDAAHQAGTSGHNPDDSPANAGRPEWNGDPDGDPEVRAWDMDSDLRTPGVSAQQLVDHIRGLPGVASVLRYVIYDHLIYRASNGWKPQIYTGPSPHTEHVHFSGAWSQAADNNTTFDYHLEDLVALTADDKKWLVDNLGPAKVWAQPLLDPRSQPPGTNKKAADWLRYNEVINANATTAVVKATTAAITAAAKSSGTVDVTKLAAALAPLLAQAITAALPPDRDDVTPAELQDAIVGALKILVERDVPPAPPAQG
jgi:hypothetical protein